MEDFHRRCSETGRFVRKHPPSQDRLYGIWCAMKERCENPHNKRYARYGGRGVRVCTDWAKDFAAFAEWAENNGYTDGLTIDRIDNDGNYCPENCRWATQKQQNRNYSRNHMITYNGKTQCVADWADETGVKAATILWRLRNGKPLSEAFVNVDGRSLRWKKQIISKN